MQFYKRGEYLVFNGGVAEIQQAKKCYIKHNTILLKTIGRSQRLWPRLSMYGIIIKII